MNMIFPDLSSRKKYLEFTVNVILTAIVLLCWFYVIYSGRVATLRYLDKLDFSYKGERITVLQLEEEESVQQQTNSTIF